MALDVDHQAIVLWRQKFEPDEKLWECFVVAHFAARLRRKTLAEQWTRFMRELL